jgi:hypothetical protein
MDSVKALVKALAIACVIFLALLSAWKLFFWLIGMSS